jgi:hypothetical protein
MCVWERGSQLDKKGSEEGEYVEVVRQPTKANR